ncbi:MAG: helix-turn-helix domain-containing protein [Acidimicrobiales bacterium]
MRTKAPAALPVFRSEQQMRILGALFDHQGSELSISELAAATGVAIATASREVERLESHGVVRSRNVGRSRFVSANWDLPWAEALSVILVHTVGLPARIAAALNKFPGIHSAFIYGSWAARRSGEIGPPPQDIDLLVVGTTKREELRKALRPLEGELNLEINPVVVSSREWSSAGSDFLEELRSRPMFELDFERSSPA